MLCRSQRTSMRSFVVVLSVGQKQDDSELNFGEYLHRELERKRK